MPQAVECELLCQSFPNSVKGWVESKISLSNLFSEKSLQQINFPSKVNLNIKLTKK